MAKKTNKEIYLAAQVKWDKARRPHQSEPDFKRRYEESRLEWLKLKYKDFEVTEAVRSDLRPFIRNYTFGATNKVLLSQTTSKFLYATKLTGDYTFECSGKQTVRTLAITPRQIDTDFMLDPYNQPDDTEPVYIEENDGDGIYFKILSDSIPTNVVLRYIKAPEIYDLQNSPNGFTEEDEMQQNEIIDLAVEKYLIAIGDFQTMQAQQLELANKGI